MYHSKPLYTPFFSNLWTLYYIIFVHLYITLNIHLRDTR